jgi:TonB family protein
MRAHSHIRFGAFVLLLAVAAPMAVGQPQPKPEQLEKLAVSLGRAARDGNREPFEKLRLPNAEAWFANVFGDNAGPHFGAVYARSAAELPGMMYERFREVAAQAYVNFEAATSKSLRGLARGQQPETLAIWAVSRHPEELYALWYSVKDTPKRSLGFWGYADGEFRFAGWLYLVRSKTGDSIVLLPPNASIQEPKPDKKIVPSYPSLARRAGIQGAVALRAVVGGDGALVDVTALSGHPLLVESSLEAVRKWRFLPLMVNGETLEAVVVIEVVYTLSS